MYQSATSPRGPPQEPSRNLSKCPIKPQQIPLGKIGAEEFWHIPTPGEKSKDFPPKDLCSGSKWFSKNRFFHFPGVETQHNYADRSSWQYSNNLCAEWMSLKNIWESSRGYTAEQTSDNKYPWVTIGAPGSDPWGWLTGVAPLGKLLIDGITIHANLFIFKLLLCYNKFIYLSKANSANI